MLFFLPVLTMPVAIGTIWKWLYDPAFGPINSLSRRNSAWSAAGMAHRTRWAVVAVVIVLLWSGVGYDMIIFLAGLQAIPRDYYEAASLDGAGAWQQLPRHHPAPADPHHLLPLRHRRHLLAAGLRSGLCHDPHRPDQQPAHRRLLHL